MAYILINSVYEQGSKMMGEMIRNQMVPRVDNNPSWEDLRNAYPKRNNSTEPESQIGTVPELTASDKPSAIP